MKLRKQDLYLIAGCLLLAILLLLAGRWLRSGKNDLQAVVYVGDQEYGRYSLNKDMDLVIPGKNGGTNELVVKDGCAAVVSASCPDKICMHQGKISEVGETIACMPNRVIVTIEAKKAK